jgi:glyoxylase-like metal-dependent hydrolase (beta-lactamase superfamily II)
VKVRADAFPVTEPLPAGVDGATVVVEPLGAGRSHQPVGYFESEGRGLGAMMRAIRGPEADLPIPAYLVHHPGAGPILVDTGLHPSVAHDPRDNMGRIASRWYSLDEGSDVPSQLLRRGIRPEDIAVVVLTHLHTDHASAISEFPNATFVLSAAEWEAATGRPRLIDGYRPAHYDFAFDYVTVDFDREEISSYGTFGRTFDLFGDGSIRLAYTPGHSAGNVSVVLALPRRDFVVASDVAYTWRQLQGGPEPYRVHDRHNWRRSLKELQAFRQAYPYALIVPGHDPVFWEKLDARYEE